MAWRGDTGSRRSISNPKCDFCSDSRHVSSKCPIVKRKPSSTRACITATVAGKKVDGIVVSTSEGPNTVARMLLPHQLSSIKWNNLELKEWVLLPIVIGSQRFVIDARVDYNNSAPLVLGSNFQTKCGIVLDFERGVISFPGKEDIPITLESSR